MSVCKELTVNGHEYILKSEMPEREGKVPAVIFTDQRGVFFGWIDSNDKGAKTIVATGVRNCIYWAKSVGGVFGLAATGPNAECRIGALCAEVTLQNVHGVALCSAEALRAWEAAPCYK